MMNRNNEFELFTRRVYQKLVNNDVLKPTKVEHNVKLQGKSGDKYQIDVYWEYEIAGNKHRVAIECKNYSSLVPVGKVRDFQGVLTDLNNVIGIMVTSRGFQKGAINYAEEYGISLKELRIPESDDIAGEITTKFHINRISCLYQIDEDCAKHKGINLQHLREFYASFDYKKADKWNKATHFPLEITSREIRDSTGKKISSLDELEVQHPKNPEPNSSQVFKFEDAWIETRYWGTVKIREVKYEFESENLERTIQLAAELFVDAILKDAINGEIQYVPR